MVELEEWFQAFDCSKQDRLLWVFYIFLDEFLSKHRGTLKMAIVYNYRGISQIEKHYNRRQVYILKFYPTFPLKILPSLISLCNLLIIYFKVEPSTLAKLSTNRLLSYFYLNFYMYQPATMSFFQFWVKDLRKTESFISLWS